MGNKIFEEKQAFNFYRSYYETSLLLDKEDKAEFLEAILNYQFTGELIEPNSKYALLAFRGQIHSLHKQVNGYIKGKSTYPYGNPTKGIDKASDKGNHKQVQEKVKEEEKVKEKEEYNTIPAKAEILDFDLLLKYLNSKTGRNFRVVSSKIKDKYKVTLKQGYTKDDIRTAIDNAVKAKNHIENNFQYLTLEFFSRPDKLDMYSDKSGPIEIEGETSAERSRREYIENYKNIKIH